MGVSQVAGNPFGSAIEQAELAADVKLGGLVPLKTVAMAGVAEAVFETDVITAAYDNYVLIYSHWGGGTLKGYVALGDATYESTNYDYTRMDDVADSLVTAQAFWTILTGTSYEHSGMILFGAAKDGVGFITHLGGSSTLGAGWTLKSGYNSNTGALFGFKLKAGSGNWTGGTVTLYGVKKSA